MKYSYSCRSKPRGGSWEAGPPAKREPEFTVEADVVVIGADARNIPGLYAVGNVAGGMYAVDYPLLLNGNSYGRALAYAMQLGDVLSAK